MPASLFNAFPSSYKEEYSNLFVMGLVAGIVIMLAMIIVAKLIYRKRFFRGELSYEAQFAFIFNNATFLGYPIISSAFGARGVVPYCGFIIAFNFALFSYGIWLFERKFDWKFLYRTITNPNIIAVVLGLVLYLTHVTVTPIISDAVHYVSNITTPLSLICIGYMLSTAKIRDLIKKWRLLIITILQLTISPLMTFGLLNLMNFPA
jgi:predicted permease